MLRMFAETSDSIFLFPINRQNMLPNVLDRNKKDLRSQSVWLCSNMN